MPAQIIPIAKAAPVENVVDMCRELLARAESGELRSLLYIVALPDGKREHFASKEDDLFSLLGALARMQHRIQCGMDENMKAV